MRYIFGDLHANVTQLNTLQKILDIKSDDICVFVGDYLGKNPYTKETIAAIRDLQNVCTCILLKGNHDYIWERYLLHGETFRNDFLLKHGDVATLEELSDEPASLLELNRIETIKKYLSEYITLLDDMHDYYQTDNFIVTHAGIAEDKIDEKNLVFEEKDYFLRPEKLPLEKQYLGQYTVVAGHTFLDVEPTVKSGYINIDLGAGYGKYLGALCVENSEVVRSDGKVFNVAI